MNLNRNTIIILSVILTVFLIGVGASVWGAFSIPIVNADYIRQGSATRLFEGGGTSFGK